MSPSQKWLLVFGVIMGFISVAAGAFGAHALKNRLSSEMLSVFEIGARYQMYHAFAIFISVWLSTFIATNLSLIAGWIFLVGTFIFSGSLYALALTGIKILGAITPIGGVLFLIGWVLLGISIFK